MSELKHITDDNKESRLAKAIDKLTVIQDNIEDVKEDIKNDILASFTTGTHRFLNGDGKEKRLYVRDGSGRLDIHMIEAMMPVDKFPQLYSKQVDVHKVRDYLTDEELEKFKVYSKPSVYIKEYEPKIATKIREKGKK